MAQSRLSDSLAREALDAFAKHNNNRTEAARYLGLDPRTFTHRLNTARLRLENQKGNSPEILAAAVAGGIEDPRNLAHFWKITKDEAGNGYSLFVKNPKSGLDVSITDLVRETIEEVPVTHARLEKRSLSGGSHLLVIDLADVHFLKLSVKAETGQAYNRDIARHRVIEGTKSLLRMATPMGIGRILFVLGNDILHVDGPRSMTTSGTFQDTDGTVFQGFKDAADAI